MSSAIRNISNTPWGCVIYRTTYTPLSQLHFPKILHLTNSMVLANSRKQMVDNDDAGQSSEFVPRPYKPVVMNNPDHFQGMTLQAVREHYRSYLESSEKTRPETNDDFCVLIDEEVVRTLADVPADPLNQRGADFSSLFIDKARDWWVKVVETEPDAGDKGWMKCSVSSIWSLWLDMDGSVGMRTWKPVDPDDHGVYYN